jgi:hypothetical protein
MMESTSSDRSDQVVDAGSEAQAAAAMEEIRSIDVITEVDVAAVTHDAGYVQLQVLEEVDHDPAESCMNDASCTDVATVAACASSASNRSSYSSTSSCYCR